MIATEMPRVQVTRAMIGLFQMQVCAIDDATDEEILAVCNAENPAGTTNGWCEVERTTDDSLERENNPAPVPCEDHPGRTHFLVSC